jgi:hypothetical protein
VKTRISLKERPLHRALVEPGVQLLRMLHELLYLVLPHALMRQHILGGQREGGREGKRVGERVRGRESRMESSSERVGERVSGRVSKR